MTCYAVVLPKGGTTKTTTAAELVVALTAKGRRVLAIDLCRQGNLSSRLGITEDTPLYGVSADVLMGTAQAHEVAAPSPVVEGASVLAGTTDLDNINSGSRPEIVTSLRAHLPELVDHFDDVVIDTAPAMQLTSLAALAAAEVVVAAVACEFESLAGLPELEMTISDRVVATRLNRDQRIDFVVPTKYDKAGDTGRRVLEQLHRDYPGKVTDPVRLSKIPTKAWENGLPSSLYRPKAGFALDYAQAMATVTASSPRIKKKGAKK